MTISFTIISNIAVTKCVPTNKKREDLFINDIFEPEQITFNCLTHTHTLQI